MELDFSKKIANLSNAAAVPGLVDLATIFRAAYLVAHNSHHLIKGPTFFEDHEFLGELYGTYEEAYDSVVERLIGLTGNADVITINSKACSIAAQFNPTGKNSTEIFSYILNLEKAFCQVIKTTVPGCTDGTQNLLQDLADQSEHRQYKISRKIL